MSSSTTNSTPQTSSQNQTQPRSSNVTVLSQRLHTRNHHHHPSLLLPTHTQHLHPNKPSTSTLHRTRQLQPHLNPTKANRTTKPMDGGRGGPSYIGQDAHEEGGETDNQLRKTEKGKTNGKLMLTKLLLLRHQVTLSQIPPSQKEMWGAESKPHFPACPHANSSCTSVACEPASG
jgi:hypothetical protein